MGSRPAPIPEQELSVKASAPSSGLGYRYEFSSSSRTRIYDLARLGLRANSPAHAYENSKLLQRQLDFSRDDESSLYEFPEGMIWLSKGIQLPPRSQQIKLYAPKGCQLRKKSDFQGQWLLWGKQCQGIEIAGIGAWGLFSQKQYQQVPHQAWAEEGFYFAQVTDLSIHRARFSWIGDAALRITADIRYPEGNYSDNVHIFDNHFDHVYQVSTTMPGAGRAKNRGGCSNYWIYNNRFERLKGGLAIKSRLPMQNIHVFNNHIQGPGFATGSSQIDMAGQFRNVFIRDNTLVDSGHHCIAVYRHYDSLDTHRVGLHNIHFEENTVLNSIKGAYFRNSPFPAGQTPAMSLYVKNNSIQGIGPGERPMVISKQGTRYSGEISGNILKDYDAQRIPIYPPADEQMIVRDNVELP